MRLTLEGGAAGVAEGLVSLADRLAPAGLRGAALELVALRRVAGDAVEEGAKDLRGVKPLRVDRLVDEQLVHHELAHGHSRHSPEQRLEALVEAIGGRRLRGEPPLDGLSA